MQTLKIFSPSTMLSSVGTFGAALVWNRLSPRTFDTLSSSFKRPCKALTHESWRWPAPRRPMQYRHPEPGPPCRLDLREDSMSSPANSSPARSVLI